MVSTDDKTNFKKAKFGTSLYTPHPEFTVPYGGLILSAEILADGIVKIFLEYIFEDCDYSNIIAGNLRISL